jgi:hypothetical protein
LTRQGVDLHGAEPQTKYARNKGYVQQAQRLTGALAPKHTSPKCRWCEQLGDTIIILQAPAKAIPVTADQGFLAFGEILNREIRRLPSLAELKRRAEAQPEKDES